MPDPDPHLSNQALYIHLLTFLLVYRTPEHDKLLNLRNILFFTRLNFLGILIWSSSLSVK
jgi:hypothetical protein